MDRQNTPELDLDDIQGDVLTGMHKNAELFLFFRITDVPRFKAWHANSSSSG